MGVGAVGGWSWYDDTGGGYDQGDGSLLLDSKAKSKLTVRIADRPGITPGNALARRRAKVMAKAFRESVTIAAKRAIQQGCAQRAKKEECQKENEIVTKEKAKDRGVGERAFGRWTEKSHKESGGGSSRRRKTCWEHRVGWESREGES